MREASTLCEGQDASKYIRDAVKLLSSHEIYAPSITRFRDGDRVAAQYYDGLIRVRRDSANLVRFHSTLSVSNDRHTLMEVQLYLEHRSMVKKKAKVVRTKNESREI